MYQTAKPEKMRFRKGTPETNDLLDAIRETGWVFTAYTQQERAKLGQHPSSTLGEIVNLTPPDRIGCQFIMVNQRSVPITILRQTNGEYLILPTSLIRVVLNVLGNTPLKDIAV